MRSKAILPLSVTRRALWALAACGSLICSGTAQAQTTAFTYQGRLTDAGSPADGQYDFQFKLFDTPDVGTGTQFGPTVTLPSVTVGAGLFTVPLDFGAGVFPGATRFLEIAVKPAGGPTFTTLSPRQPLTSAPYTVRSLGAALADGLSVACVNCVTSSQIQSVQGSQIVGPIPVASVPAGSAFYVQNTTSPQAGANFNIAGNGSASILNAATEFDLGSNRILSNAGTNNLFVGQGAGQVNAAGGNSFVGWHAGNVNTGGDANSFFGAGSGQVNTTGSNNAFFGGGSGGSNTTGNSNSIFGVAAGFFGSSGSDNSFFGHQAGQHCTAGGNSFFGSGAGAADTTGGANAFFGFEAGASDTTGGNNTFVGYVAGVANVDGNSNTFVGAGAGNINTTGSHNSFVGEAAGQSNTTGSDNVFVGQQAGVNSSTGGASTFVGRYAGLFNTTGFNNVYVGWQAGMSSTTAYQNAFVGDAAGQNTIDGPQNAFFGSGAGFANTSGTVNSFFGFQTGVSETTGAGNSFFGAQAGTSFTTGINNSFFGDNAGYAQITGSNNTYVGTTATGADGLQFSTALGSGAFADTSHTVVLGTNLEVVIVPGKLEVQTLGTAGSQQLCLNATNRLAPCSSSLRYKTDLQPFGGGLEIVERLRPITFTWTTDHARDLGLGAEDVAEIEPLLVTHDRAGRIEGVKYDRLDVVLINAIKEQQQELQEERREIQELNAVKAENAELRAEVALISSRLEHLESRGAGAAR
jgi:hypothetical protein